jgi:hypothetical protein
MISEVVFSYKILIHKEKLKQLFQFDNNLMQISPLDGISGQNNDKSSLIRSIRKSLIEMLSCRS